MSNLQEIWKDIPNDFEGYYQASSLGRVRSLHNGRVTIMRVQPDKRGYQKIKLQKEGKMLTTGVHRLVALAFHPNPHNLPEVNHKDGVTNNNKPSNLEWCTQQANVDHKMNVLFTDDKRRAFAEKMRDPERCRKIGDACRGSKNGFAKKVVDTATGQVFGCVGDAAQKYGYTYSQLKQWLNGRRKNLSTLKYKEAV
jgi:hypothetical protein